jgi:tetratricopeptide (TPR) repeat protein
MGLLGLLALLLVPGTQSFAQSSALTESARAFYRGDYVHAAQLAERHLRKYPNDAPMRVMLARAVLAQGNFHLAVEQLHKALQSDPRNIDALYYLSLAARELSQREYQRLVALAPDSARVHQLAGEAALAAENHSEAEAEFQSALKANPRSIEVATELAELKRSQSKFDEALTYYEQAAKIGPLNYEIAYGLGACYTYKQDYPQAIKWLRKAVAFAPDSASGRFALGNALFQSSQFEAAIPELRTSLRLEPKLKQAYFLLGRAYTKLGRQEEAQAAFRKLDELNRSELPSSEREAGGTMSPKPETP